MGTDPHQHFDERVATNEAYCADLNRDRGGPTSQPVMVSVVYERLLPLFEADNSDSKLAHSNRWRCAR